MISPMTKYSILAYHKDYDVFLDKLRTIGVAHVIEKNNEVSEEISKKFQNINKVNDIIRKLEKIKSPSEKPKTKKQTLNGEDVYNKIDSIYKKIDTLNQRKNDILNQIKATEPWGNFDSELLNKILEAGIKIKFFVSPNRVFDDNWEKNHNIFIINKSNGNVYFVLIDDKNKTTELNAEEISSPKFSINDLSRKLNKAEQRINFLKNCLNDFAETSIDDLYNYRNLLIEDIELEKVYYNTENELDNNLKIIEIWCPDDKIENLEKFLDKSDVYYVKSKPSPNDKVPVLLKNKKFSKDFEAIGEMYTLPKYGELDLTPFFAPFYTLFFGFCLGDTGYGILLIFAAIFLYKKYYEKFKTISKLVIYLGTSTALFGLISGTFFGINLYQTELPFYASMQEYFDSQNTNINNFLFYLSLIIGGIQIIFGMFLKLINELIQYGWKLALGTIGWLFLILGSITIYLLGQYSSVSENHLSLFQNLVLIISGVLILFLNNLNRKIYINLGIGLWNSYNMMTGIIGDLLSYIRLFALGVSSAVLGYVFNSIALSLSGSIPIIGVIIMIIILIIGHSINIFMSGLGAFVHPLRLTFVEFYKNAGFTGGGKKYHPFKKIV